MSYVDTHTKPIYESMKLSSFFDRRSAKRSNSICVYEDLTIAEFDRGKKNNKRDSMWVRGQLTKKIQSKLDWLGIPARCCRTCLHIENVP